jgi:hypothetical protein
MTTENKIEDLGQRIIDRPATLADQMRLMAQAHPAVLELVRAIGNLTANLYEAVLEVGDSVHAELSAGADLETGMAVAATVASVSGEALELGRTIFETRLHEDAIKLAQQTGTDAVVRTVPRPQVPQPTVDPTVRQTGAVPAWRAKQRIVDDNGRVMEVLSVGEDAYFMRVVGGRLYVGEPREYAWDFESANACRLLEDTECVDAEGVHPEHDFDDLGLCSRCGAEAYDDTDVTVSGERV